MDTKAHTPQSAKSDDKLGPLGWLVLGAIACAVLGFALHLFSSSNNPVPQPKPTPTCSWVDLNGDGYFDEGECL